MASGKVNDNLAAKHHLAQGYDAPGKGVHKEFDRLWKPLVGGSSLIHDDLTTAIEQPRTMLRRRQSLR
jgi:hypothetical protein